MEYDTYQLSAFANPVRFGKRRGNGLVPITTPPVQGKPGILQGAW